MKGLKAQESELEDNHEEGGEFEAEMEGEDAKYQRRHISPGGVPPSSPGPGPFPGSVELDKNGKIVAYYKSQPLPAVSNGRGPKAQVEHPFQDDQYEPEDEYEEDNEYKTEDEDEEDKDEDDGDREGEDGDGRHPRVTSRRTSAPTSTRRRTAADAKPERDELFSLGSSLTVTGKSILLSISVELSQLKLVRLNLYRSR